MKATGFVPPPYPYDRLNELKPLAADFDGGLIDLSIGTPRDPSPEAVAVALAPLVEPPALGPEVGYPPSIGVPSLRESARDWMHRRFEVELGAEHLGICIGTKEIVASTPHYLHMRYPDRDTVLYPEISYPTYAMGATFAGCRSVAVPVDEQWRLRLDAIDPADAARALCLWVNSPGNPAGGLDDLDAAATWGRSNDVLVLSDECYIEYTWANPYGLDRANGVVGRSILESGTEGVLAVHSLSKRSNFAGGRIGFYAGDADLVYYLSEMRKHAGMMPPGPMQAAGAAAFADDAHVDVQRARYSERLELLAGILRRWGLDVSLPEGGFYLWIAAPEGDAWGLVERLIREGGVLASPGEFYGPAGTSYVRLALVESLERIEMIGTRLLG